MTNIVNREADHAGTDAGRPESGDRERRDEDGALHRIVVVGGGAGGLELVPGSAIVSAGAAGERHIG